MKVRGRQHRKQVQFAIRGETIAASLKAFATWDNHAVIRPIRGETIAASLKAATTDCVCAGVSAIRGETIAASLKGRMAR